MSISIDYPLISNCNVDMKENPMRAKTRTKELKTITLLMSTY